MEMDLDVVACIEFYSFGMNHSDNKQLNTFFWCNKGGLFKILGSILLYLFLKYHAPKALMGMFFCILFWILKSYNYVVI